MFNRKMFYRRFGRTGLQMPVFSCGGMRYQHSWDDIPPDTIPAANQDILEQCIHRAVELGINHIETARGYGTSEIQLGRVLPTLPREKIIVQTKVCPDKDTDKFLKTFDQSMANLRLDYVDLFSIHGINTPELLHHTLKKGGCLEAAFKLKEQGRCRHIGFATHGPLPVLMDAVNCGLFDYINLHWYFIFQKNWPAIEAARRHDMGVFIISPSDKGGMLYKPSAKLAKLCEPVSPMIFNDLFCLLHPEVHTLSIGAAKPTDFDEHIRALEFFPQAEALTREISGRINAAMQEVLGDDWINPYVDSIPECYDIPGEINVREIIRLWTWAKGLEMIEFGKMRYNLLGQADHWFPGNTAAIIQEDALLEKIKNHPRASRIIPILKEAHELLKGDPKQRLSKGD